MTTCRKKRRGGHIPIIGSRQNELKNEIGSVVSEKIFLNSKNIFNVKKKWYKNIAVSKKQYNARYLKKLFSKIPTAIFSNGRILRMLEILWQSRLGSLSNLLSNLLKSLGFPTFWLWAYLMKVIPETRRLH